MKPKRGRFGVGQAGSRSAEHSSQWVSRGPGVNFYWFVVLGFFSLKLKLQGLIFGMIFGWNEGLLL